MLVKEIGHKCFKVSHVEVQGSLGDGSDRCGRQVRPIVERVG